MELPVSVFRFLYITLSHAVDEVEDFEPVQKKPQLESDTEADGMCLISNLYASWLLACSPVQCIHSSFYIAVEEVDGIELEPAPKKMQLDFDRDSAMGLSVFTSGNSTTLSEVSLFMPTNNLL